MNLKAYELLIEAINAMPQDAYPIAFKKITEAAAIIREAAESCPRVEAPSGTVREFARAILHGDEKHRAWLLDAAERFVAGVAIDNPAARAAPVEAPSGSLLRPALTFPNHPVIPRTDAKFEAIAMLLDRVRSRRGSDQMRKLRGERPQDDPWPWIHEGELVAAIESLCASEEAPT